MKPWKKVSELSPGRRRRLINILELLGKREGQSQGAIARALGVTPSVVSVELKFLRAAYGTKLPDFIPPKKWAWSLDRAKQERIQNTILFAEQVIMGKAKKAISGRCKEKSEKVIIALKKNPLMPDTRIATDCRVDPMFVVRRRKWLVESGEIPAISGKERQRFALRTERGVLSDRQIRATIKKYDPMIHNAANGLFKSNMVLFKSIKISPNDIAANLKRKLVPRLEAYVPVRMKGPEETKLHRFVNMELYLAKSAYLCYVKKRYAHLKAAAAVTPKEKAKPPARELTATERIKLIARLEKLSTKLDLPPMQKAVLYCLEAKIPEAETGRHLGITRERVRQIKNILEKKATPFEGNL